MMDKCRPARRARPAAGGEERRSLTLSFTPGAVGASAAAGQGFQVAAPIRLPCSRATAQLAEILCTSLVTYSRFMLM